MTSTRRQKLAAEYVARIGYDPFEDDPSRTEDEVAQTLLEHAEAGLESDTDEVAQTILAQMGGRQFLAMTGAHDLVGSKDRLVFRLPTSPAGFVKDGINKVIVRLNSRDLYDLDFGRLQGAYYESVACAEDIHVENLREVFTRHTGLDCTL